MPTKIEFDPTIDALGAARLLVSDDLYTESRVARLKNGDTPIEGVKTRLGIGLIDYDENHAARKNELKKLLISGVNLIPTKFLYSLEGGWEAWLEMTANDDLEYSFFKNSLETLSRFKKEIISEAIKASQNVEFDIVSLGCGDGKKDTIILNELCPKLVSRSALIEYFPLEISDQLINEAVNYIWNNCKYVHKFKVFL